MTNVDLDDFNKNLITCLTRATGRSSLEYAATNSTEQIQGSTAEQEL